MDAQSSKDDRRSGSEQSTDQPPPQTPVGNEQGVNRVTGTQPRQKEESGGIPRRWEIGIGAFLAVVNFAALFIYGYQLIEMRKATEAATRSANIATEASHLEQRAWVATTADVKSAPPQEGAKLKGTIPIKNTGKSFARKVAMEATISFVKTGTKPDFAVPKHPTSDPPLTDLLLSPGGEYAFNWFTKEALTKKELEAITPPPDGIAESYVVIYGYITYYDIFECDHWTIFCFYLNSEGWDWKICAQHNDADNINCKEPTEK